MSWRSRESTPSFSMRTPNLHKRIYATSEAGCGKRGAEIRILSHGKGMRESPGIRPCCPLSNLSSEERSENTCPTNFTPASETLSSHTCILTGRMLARFGLLRFRSGTRPELIASRKCRSTPWRGTGNGWKLVSRLSQGLRSGLVVGLL